MDVEELIRKIETIDLSDGRGPHCFILSDSNDVKPLWIELCKLARLGVSASMAIKSAWAEPGAPDNPQIAKALALLERPCGDQTQDPHAGQQ